MGLLAGYAIIGNEKMKEDVKEKYLELQMLNSQLQQLQQQIRNADMQSAEMDKISFAIEEAKSIKKGQEMLVPLGQGIFIKAKAEDANLVIMSVGADVAVEKSLDDAIAIVKTQQGELSSIILEMKHEFSDGVQRLHSLQNEMPQEQPVEKKKKK